MEAGTGERAGPSSRAGNLWVFWPAFLAWSVVAAWLACDRFGVWAAVSPSMASGIEWMTLSLVILAPVGAVWVSLRSRIARHWFPITLNLSTVLIAYVAISCTVASYRVSALIEWTAERQQQTQKRLDALVREHVDRK